MLGPTPSARCHKHCCILLLGSAPAAEGMGWHVGVLRRGCRGGSAGWGEAQALWPVPTCCPARALPVPGRLATQVGGLVFPGASMLGGGRASWTGGIPERVLCAGVTFPLRRSTGVFTSLSEPSTGMRPQESPPQMWQQAPFLQKGLLVLGSVAPKPRPGRGPAGVGRVRSLFVVPGKGCCIRWDGPVVCTYRRSALCPTPLL